MAKAKPYKDLFPFTVFVYRGRQYTKVGESHCIDSNGKDAILHRLDQCVPLYRAQVSFI